MNYTNCHVWVHAYAYARMHTYMDSLKVVQRLVLEKRGTILTLESGASVQWLDSHTLNWDVLRSAAPEVLQSQWNDYRLDQAGCQSLEDRGAAPFNYLLVEVWQGQECILCLYIWLSLVRPGGDSWVWNMHSNIRINVIFIFSSFLIFFFCCS